MLTTIQCIEERAKEEREMMQIAGDMTDRAVKTFMGA